MNTNLNTQLPSTRAVSGDGWATIAGIIGSALLLAKKVLGSKAAKPEPMSRADFYAELAALKDEIHKGHLAILEKLDSNHRDLLAVADRLATRINTVEAGLARVDERTRK